MMEVQFAYITFNKGFHMQNLCNPNYAVPWLGLQCKYVVFFYMLFVWLNLCCVSVIQKFKSSLCQSRASLVGRDFNWLK